MSSSVEDNAVRLLKAVKVAIEAMSALQVATEYARMHIVIHTAMHVYMTEKALDLDAHIAAYCTHTTFCIWCGGETLSWYYYAVFYGDLYVKQENEQTLTRLAKCKNPLITSHT